MDKIIQTFMADRYRVTGPKEDGGSTVSFMTGQDQQIEVAKMLAFPQQVRLRVTVEYEPLPDEASQGEPTKYPTQDEYFESLMDKHDTGNDEVGE